MIRWIVLGITASFLVGFIVGAKKIFPYEPIRSSYLIAHSKMKQEVSAIKNFSSCTIEEIKNVPNSSTAFIGHAYGSLSKNNFIAKNVSNFIEKNSHLLSSIVFTGDVFVVPSSEKWLQLEEIGSDLRIYVAPGNHDVLRADSREIFERSVYGQIKFPRTINTSLGKVILEDSTSTKWTVSTETIDMLNANQNETNIVARHNIPIVELLEFANSPAGLGDDLDTLPSLKSKIKSGKTIWIIGDTGYAPHHPRLKCLSSENHMFVMNGIGEVQGDTVLIAVDGNLYSYIIK